MLKYITISDLANVVRNNLWKIPHDVDLVVGVARSGMFAATMIAEYLNVPLIDNWAWVKRMAPGGGNRVMFNNKFGKYNKVLVIDDTCYSGKAMKQVREQMKEVDGYEYIYACVFLEAQQGRQYVDIYLEDISSGINFLRGEICLYEWNIFHHYNFIAERAEFDYDGVFCLDPPSDENKEEYERYIKDATPLFIPTVKIGKIVTYRLEKYRDISDNWLKRMNIRYDKMYMFNAPTPKDRYMSGISPEMMKATIYVNNPNDILFFESDDWQARKINEMSGKPVYCVSTNKMYN